jgi:hypothetical protein
VPISRWPNRKTWDGLALLVLFPAVIFFGAWQATPYLALAIYLPVGLLLLLSLMFFSGSGESRQAGKGCTTIFGLISIGCAIGIAASQLLNSLKA